MRFFKKKQAKPKFHFDGRKTAEMGVAALITGVLTPSIKRTYDDFFDRRLTLSSISLADLVEMDTDDGDDYEDYE